MKILTMTLVCLPLMCLAQKPVTQAMDSQRNYYTLYDDGTYEKLERKNRQSGSSQAEETTTVVNGTQNDSITTIYVNGENLADIEIEYIRIFTAQKGLSSQVLIGVDFGQRFKTFGGKDQLLLKDQDNREIILNSAIDALNLFAKHGFEFIQAYESIPDNANGRYLNYLLRRPIK